MDLFAFDDLYVRRLKEHDRETEAHFSDYFRKLLYVKLRKRLSPEDIDDVTQDVFLRVLSRLDELRDSHKLGAFVLGFCNRVVLERYRNESRTEPLDEKHHTIAGRSDTEAEFMSEEAAAGVRLVLRGMRKRDAAILREIFLDDEDREEICRRYGVTPEYLRVRLHRASRKFKAAYRPKIKPRRFPPDTFTLALSLYL